MNHTAELASIVSADMPGDTLLLVLGAMPVPLAWFRLDDGKAMFVNRAFKSVFGYSAEEVVSWSHWSSCFPDAEQRDRALGQWLAQTRKRKSEEADAGLPVKQIELRALAGDGTERTVLHSGVVLPAINCALAIYIDITARKQDELRMAEVERVAREREMLYPILLNHAHEMIIVSSSEGVRRFVSPAVLALTGWTQAEYLSQRLENMAHPDDYKALLAVRERCNNGATGELIRYRFRHKDGSWLWMEALASCYKDPVSGKVLGAIATLRDYSQQQAEEAKRKTSTALLEQQARYDSLTGVANRHVLYSALRDEARRQSRHTQALALLLIDVDFFKAFNDRYGHLEGDCALQRVAEVLKASTHRVTDLVTRFGGEEFVLFLPMTDPEGAMAIARGIRNALATEAIPHMDSPMGLLTVSIGIACWPGSTALDRDKLLLHADRALYKAKNLGRNRFCMHHHGDMESEAFLKLDLPESHETKVLKDLTGVGELLPGAG